MPHILSMPATTDDILLDSLSPGDFLRFSRTCTHFHNVVRAYIVRRFQLSSTLSPWFSDLECTLLRFIMSKTGMVISGSVALQFFDRDRYMDSDLDLFLPITQCVFVSRWLQTIGYRRIPPCEPHMSIADTIDFAHGLHRPTSNKYGFSRPDRSPGSYSVAVIINFERPANHGRKIQLIGSSRSPVECILKFHSSCVVNLITHEKAYCLFPSLTLDDHVSVPFTHTTPALTGASGIWINTPPVKSVRKYIRRGFSFSPESEFCMADSDYRFIGDARTWAVPIPPIISRNGSLLTLPSSTIEANSFQFTECQFLFMHPDFHHFAFLSAFSQQYTFSDEEAKFVRRFLPSWLKQHSDELNDIRKPLDRVLLHLLRKFRQYGRNGTDYNVMPLDSDLQHV